MLTTLKLRKEYSSWALNAFVVCVVMAVALSVADGLVRASPRPDIYTQTVLVTCVSDFRFLFEQGIYASTIFWVGARFVETRTILTVGFDRIDAARISVTGPDPDNVVWIGRRYGDRLEAEAVVGAIQERLRQSSDASSGP